MDSAKDGDASEEFWNKKAETFPRFEEGENNYEAGVLQKIRGAGVDFHGRTVLDVGCGSGMYTLRIAKEARRVTALDISGRMLDILRQDAARLGLTNIDYVRSSFDDFESQATFDIVFSSMTPAVRDDESRRKLLRYAAGWTVFMGFAGRMDSDMMRGLYEHFKITPRVYNDGPEMREWLDARGVAHTRIPVQGRWVQSRGKQETIASCSSMLIPYGVTPDPAFMEEYIKDFERAPGVFVEHTDYLIELVIWNNKAAQSFL